MANTKLEPLSFTYSSLPNVPLLQLAKPNFLILSIFLLLLFVIPGLPLTHLNCSPANYTHYDLQGLLLLTVTRIYNFSGWRVVDYLNFYLQCVQ